MLCRPRCSLRGLFPIRVRISMVPICANVSRDVRFPRGAASPLPFLRFYRLGDGAAEESALGWVCQQDRYKVVADLFYRYSGTAGVLAGGGLDVALFVSVKGPFGWTEVFGASGLYFYDDQRHCVPGYKV